MTDRLNKIFDILPNCDVFADIGCDHGYMTLAMLKSGKCKKAIVSDVSEKCLQKARDLLSKYIESGVVESAVSDGFDNVGECDLALIAGMGGEEICSILVMRECLPQKLVLQPMKNTDKVRRCALQLGYRFIRDFTFFSAGKFYDIISLEKGCDSLTDEEIEFGRDNLKERPDAFIIMLEDKIEKLNFFMAQGTLKEQSKEQMQRQIERLKQYV